MKLEKLKTQSRIYYSLNNSMNKKINELKKDIKLIKLAINDNYDCSAERFSTLSVYNYSLYTIVIDKDLNQALKFTKALLKDAFNQRFWKERASRFFDLTGNDKLDSIALSQIETCRELLFDKEASLEEVFKILPTNHKFTL